MIWSINRHMCWIKLEFNCTGSESRMRGKLRCSAVPLSAPRDMDCWREVFFRWAMLSGICFLLFPHIWVLSIPQHTNNQHPTIPFYDFTMRFICLNIRIYVNGVVHTAIIICVRWLLTGVDVDRVFCVDKRVHLSRSRHIVCADDMPCVVLEHRSVDSGLPCGRYNDIRNVFDFEFCGFTIFIRLQNFSHNSFRFCR